MPSAESQSAIRTTIRRELDLGEIESRPSQYRTAKSAWRLPLSLSTILLALVLGTPPAGAQGIYPPLQIPGTTFDAGDRSAPALGDLDGDGDLDAVVGNADGTLRWAENTGSSSAPAFLEASDNAFTGIDVGTFSSPVLADLDGDGDLDATVGEQNGQLRYFENTGSSSAPAFAEAPVNPFDGIDVSFYSAPTLADLDGDGDLDATIGHEFGGLRYFENTGSSSSPAFSEPFPSPFDGIDVGDYSTCALADLDGDGDLDAILGEQFEDSLLYFENTGSSSAPAFEQATANPFEGLDDSAWPVPKMMDLNGDGDLDAIVGHWQGTVLYYENTGSSSAPAFVDDSANPFVEIDFGFSSAPALGDLDGDGDDDAAIGNGTGTLAYLENTGSSSAPAFGLAAGNPFDGIDPVTSPALADLDGDGDLDAVVANSMDGLSYLENSGDSSAPAFVEASANPFAGIDLGNRGYPAMADLDGDGDFDAIVGEFDGSVFYFENTGSSSAPAFLEATDNPFDFIDFGIFGQPRPTLADLDGDGDFDAILGAKYGELVYYENTGSSSAPAFEEAIPNPFAGVDVGEASSPALADLDGDGDLDVLLGNGEGELFYLRSRAHGFEDGFESGDTSAWAVAVGGP